MDPSAKRKHSTNNASNDRQTKRSKGGSNGRWQTPHQKTKLDSLRGKGLEVGDMGIWTTAVKGKERQALGEMIDICNEYAESLYGIKPPEASDEDEKEDDDIEASIKKEIAGMKPTAKPKDSTFEPIRMDLDCLGFIRTRPPVDPVELVQRICKDAKKVTDKTQRRSRFINRFTPITLTAKANESGLEEVAKTVLEKHFQLVGDEDEETTNAKFDAYSYAIRPTFRAHNTLKRDDVIKKVASLIGPRHKVNLSSPDKVILIDIFQTFCGMSVVDGDWESLKRYNLHELYLTALKAPSGPSEKPTEETTSSTIKPES
ncbi:hypothetical protein F4677DRAFT_436945 [Hypoxylon crocopeplum]|nr:hypothetical protein F4677DRAFT_436945 [Hypoxylon crocopeplum]